jgi:hypothetical protein
VAPLIVWQQVIGRRWLTKAFKSLSVSPGSVPPLQHIAGHDLYHAWVGVTEPEMHEITHIKPNRIQQLGRYPHLPNLRDPVRAIWHGCVRDVINFNSLHIMAWIPASNARDAAVRRLGGAATTSYFALGQGMCERNLRVGDDQAAAAYVERVSLLGIRVTAVAGIDTAEHARRQSAQVPAITDPALLDLLLALPAGVAVHDPVAWTETADQPPGVVVRDPAGLTVTRLLVPPLAISDVLVASAPGRELRTVRDASLFARFARRWAILAGGRVPEDMVLEAKLSGVGILTAAGEAVLLSEPPVGARADAWDWMLREKVYRRWITQRSPGRATASPVQATDGAMLTPSG